MSDEARQVRSRRAPRVALPPEDPPEDDTDAWMFTYMDVITLLVTLFVVLLSFASFENTAQQIARNEKPAPRAEESVASKGQSGQPAHAVETTTDALRAVLAALGSDPDIRLEPDENHTTLRLGERVLFPRGSARLSQGGRALLQRFLPALRDSGLNVIVEGHTDPTPIATDRFPSNWELSALRATRVVRLLEAGGIPPDRLAARAYGATRPIAPNSTVRGQALNRRVALILRPPADSRQAVEGRATPEE